MADLVPNTVPGQWNASINKGATWPATTVVFIRDGTPVIPVSAALYFYVDGVLAITIAASIDGAGVMTIAGLTAVQTAAINWDYGNLLFRTAETGNVITDLLVGNVTAINYGD